MTKKSVTPATGLFISQRDTNSLKISREPESRNRMLSNNNKDRKEFTAERNNSDQEKPVETFEEQGDVEKVFFWN